MERFWVRVGVVINHCRDAFAPLASIQQLDDKANRSIEGGCRLVHGAASPISHSTTLRIIAAISGPAGVGQRKPLPSISMGADAAVFAGLAENGGGATIFSMILVFIRDLPLEVAQNGLQKYSRPVIKRCHHFTYTKPVQAVRGFWFFRWS
jgi:hypothetical protein